MASDLTEQQQALLWIGDHNPIELAWTVHLKAAAQVAAEQGHLHVLKYLWTHICVPQGLTAANLLASAIMMPAARRGHIDVLSWLHGHAENAFSYSEVSSAAIMCGRLDVLQWQQSLFPSGSHPWRAAHMALAARKGHIHIMDFLRSCTPPCAWDFHVTRNAAKFKQFEALKWLLSQPEPCACDVDCTLVPADLHDWEMLRWLRETCNPPYELHPRVLLHAFRRSGPPYQAEMGAWLIDEGAETSCLSSSDARQGDTFSMSNSCLLMLEDRNIMLKDEWTKALKQARKSICLFYGLLRWSEKHFIRDRKSTWRHPGFQPIYRDGPSLLKHVSSLPDELLDRIVRLAMLDYVPPGRRRTR